MPMPPTTRRAFLTTTAIAGASAAILTTQARAKIAPPGSGDYPYEVTRTEAEWREMLSQEEYEILRENGTEFPFSNPMWEDYSEGEFHCRGCDLHLYSSDWRAQIEMGWVFFHHAQANALLMAIDTAEDFPMNPDPNRTMIEVHCRRCGSHQGHIVEVEGDVVHCINGTSLVRRPVAA